MSHLCDKNEEYKRNIIQASIFLLEEDKNCSLQEIATKGGVSRRTLHRYFDGKEELIIAVFEINDVYQQMGVPDSVLSGYYSIDKLLSE